MNINQDSPAIELSKAAMETMPAEAWNRLVATACNTFEQTVAPLTETTAGIGRWIRQKFDETLELERVLMADAIAKAMDQVKSSHRNLSTTLNISNTNKVLDASGTCCDEDIRELWINLLAKELCPFGKPA